MDIFTLIDPLMRSAIICASSCRWSHIISVFKHVCGPLYTVISYYYVLIQKNARRCQLQVSNCLHTMLHLTLSNLMTLKGWWLWIAYYFMARWTCSIDPNIILFLNSSFAPKNRCSGNAPWDVASSLASETRGASYGGTSSSALDSPLSLPSDSASSSSSSSSIGLWS